MRLPGEVLKGIGGDKRRGITAISIIAMMLASVCGIVWGLIDTKGEREFNEAPFCKLKTREPVMKAELTTTSQPRHRLSCSGCGRG